MMDWGSSRNWVFMNPKFSIDQQRELMGWVTQVEDQFSSHVFLLTSGTSSQSALGSLDLKWVALSQAALLSSAAQVNFHLQSDHSDIWLQALPSFHVGGLGIWARAHLSGADVVRMESWNVDLFLQKIEARKCTLTALVPAQIYDFVTRQIQSPSSLRAVVVGGGAVPFSLYQSARRLGWPLLPSYGMTETASQVATASLVSLAGLVGAGLGAGLGSSGRREGSGCLPPMEMLSHVEVRVDSQKRFQIRGKSLFSAYIYQNEGQVVCRDPKVESDGWFCTQDVGTVEGKNLKILGRLGDFIKIGGESVEVGRLREILSQVQLDLKIQADVALVPVPDVRLGQVIHLISDPNLDASSSVRLIDTYNARVLGFEKIRKWRLLEKIPRTELGKLILLDCLAAIKSLNSSDPSP